MSDPVSILSGLRRRKKLCKGVKSFLSEDVIRDILSRLPEKDVLRYRCVCRGWSDLTSTRDFTNLHFQRSLPMILKDTYPRVKKLKDPTMLDGCWEHERTRSTILKVYQPCKPGSIYFSHNGLIAGRGGEGGVDLVIYNPVYTDVVNITTDLEPYKGKVCGVFFHPVLQEFCTLWEICQPFTQVKFQYKILNLESNPKWRDIQSPCIPNRGSWCTQPVLIDNYLYWLVDSCQVSIVNCYLVEYDIRKEEFKVLLCPACVNNDTYYRLNLVDTNGVVSVIQIIPSKGLAEIKIWTLKDDVEQLWTSSNYIISCDVYSHRKCGEPKALAFRNGELVFHSQGRLYVCNLKLRTVRKFGQTYSSLAEFLSHVPSLVSLSNCKSDICIAEEEESNGEEIKELD